MLEVQTRIRTAIATAFVATCLAVPAGALAQAYPSKPVRLIVPFAAGGPTDIVARLLAPPMGSAMKQAVVVENRAGAATQIGHNLVAKATPDGYTIGMTAAAAAGNVSLFKNLPFDYLRDLKGIAYVSKQPVIFAVNPVTVPVSSFKEYLEYARKHPGTTFGFQGYGGAVHLLIEEINQSHATGLTLVPYKGAAEAARALVADQLHSFAGSYAAFAPLKGNQKIRMLASSGTSRIKLLPAVPTFAEMGLEGLSKHFAWLGMVAPAGTPDAAINYLNGIINATAQLPKVAERFEALNYDFEAMTPAQFDGFMRSEVERIGVIVLKPHIKTN